MEVGGEHWAKSFCDDITTSVIKFEGDTPLPEKHNIKLFLSC